MARYKCFLLTYLFNTRAKPCVSTCRFVVLMTCVPKLLLCVHIINVRCSGLSTIAIKPVIVIVIIITIMMTLGKYQRYVRNYLVKES